MNAVMDTIKKNLLSIICAVVAVVAIIVVYFPLGGMFEGLQAKVDARVAEHGALDALLKKERKLPVLDPTALERKTLTQYPTPIVIERVNAIAADITKQAGGVLGLANELNQHKPLVPSSIPTPTRTLQIKYRDEYQKQVDFQSADPAVRNSTMVVKILKAAMPPTEAEIAAEKDKRAKEIESEKLIPGPNGNEPQVRAQINEMIAALADDLKGDVARSCLMYINPDSIDIFPGILDATNPASAPAIYFSQVGLWVQNDVFSALAAANAGSPGVMQSPVKHLVKIEVEEMAGHPGVNLQSTGPGMGFPPGGAPPPQPPPIEQPAPVDAFARAPTATGRISNPIYEVIPFKLIINVDASQVPMVMTELSRNRFITILDTDISAVDAGTAMLNGYYYGQVQVVQLSMECEILFLKNWLTKLMPVGVASPAAAAG